MTENRSAAIRAICQTAPVVPVLVIDDAAKARPIAQALIDGGLPALEVTLRTPAALDCIRAMAAVEGAIVGAGTVLTADDIKAAKDAGARFAVSPGATDALLDAAEAEKMPLLPGAATASEAMRLLARGYTMQKFFPAEAAGGAAMLKSLASPLPQVSFCPTGGITPANAPTYLALPNVVCVGGSWIAPSDAVGKSGWAMLQSLAKAATDLRT